MNDHQAQAKYRRRFEEIGGLEALTILYKDTSEGDWLRAERPSFLSHPVTHLRWQRRLWRMAPARDWDGADG